MSKNSTPGARRVVPRSRGALSGIALMVLGAWGALIPFVGPYFNFSFTPDKAWHWTSARGWLEVLPGVVAFVAGFLLLVSKSRTMTLVAAWLGILAGAWFVIGPDLQSVWHIGSPGRPAGSGSAVKVLELLALFSLLGVAIVYFAATAFGRLSVVSLRDARAAERREAAAAAEAEREQQIAAARDRDEAAEREREAAAREREAAEAAAAHERTASGRDDDSTGGRRLGFGHHGSDANDSDDATRGGVAGAAAGVAGRTHDGATRSHDHRATEGVADDHRAGGSESRPVTQGEGNQQGYQPQQGYPTQQGQPVQQGSVAQQGPATQGYAQPQAYDQQHGYPEQGRTGATSTASTEQPADTEHESLGRRLFHRR